ncbi:MAG: tRNA (adenosine(37)-N6)-threonylcarbamoyltransferase complex dimerization subunit type 1 TsaB [Solirubrobacteraceae bacterium]
MIVLGLDTATPATVVGLRLADGTVLQARDDPQVGGRPGHSTRLLDFAHRLLAEAGFGWDRIERIAVGVGPGTFTGLRIGIATARALAQSLDVDLVGVSSLRALASGGVKTVAAIDARRGEVFLAAYDAERELLAPQAVRPDALVELLAGSPLDPGQEEWTAVGDGALLYRDSFERLGLRVPADGAESHRIQASEICALALDFTEGESREDVVPDYLRRPDAELSLGGVA